MMLLFPAQYIYYVLFLSLREIIVVWEMVRNAANQQKISSVNKPKKYGTIKQGTYDVIRIENSRLSDIKLGTKGNTFRYTEYAIIITQTKWRRHAT